MAKNAIAKIIADADTFVFELPDIANEAEPSLTYEQAYDKVIASSLESVLNDGNVMDLLDTIETKDKSLWEQIRSFVEDFAALMLRTVRAFRGVHPESPEGRIVERMTEIHTQLQQAFAEGLHEAGENYRTGGQKNTADNSGVKYRTSESVYRGINLSTDSTAYSWEFLTSCDDMKVTYLPEIGEVRGSDGRIDTKQVVNMGIKSAEDVGYLSDGKIYVSNVYTGRNLRVDTASIRHGLNGDARRILTNARLCAVIGELVKNAIPVNALHNKASGVTGTYAMAAYAKDQQGREFIAVVTVEERSGEISQIDTYDVTHSVSGRQKKSSRADTMSQGVYPSTTAKISIADVLSVVNSTHQSILSNDVLMHFKAQKNPDSYYTQQTKFSARYQQNEAAAQHLQQENSRMTGEIASLTPLVQALRKMNGGKMRTAYLAEAVAHLQKIAGARGNSAEFGALRTIKKILSRFCVCLCTLVDFSEVSAKADVK